MRTTLDLDRELLEKAKEKLGAKTYTDAIEAALRAVVSKSDALAAWDALAGSELSWPSLDEYFEFKRRWGRARTF